MREWKRGEGKGRETHPKSRVLGGVSGQPWAWEESNLPPATLLLDGRAWVAPDPYLLSLDLIIVGVQLEPKIVNTGTSLYLDPHGNSAVSHAHISLMIHHYFENNIQVFEYEISCIYCASKTLNIMNVIIFFLFSICNFTFFYLLIVIFICIQ